MLKIGLTGGIGSGKSTIAAIFEVLGIPVYYADEAAKKIMNENQDLKKMLLEKFGTDTYKDGNLNREYLSNLVFNDTAKLNLLNSIVHPATIHDAAVWIQKQTTPYIIKEAALLFESKANESLDLVIGIQAPENLRIERAMKRDGISKEAVMARMNKQIGEEEKMSLCDFIIVNDEQQPVTPQVLALHEKILELSAN